MNKIAFNFKILYKNVCQLNIIYFITRSKGYLTTALTVGVLRSEFLTNKSFNR